MSSYHLNIKDRITSLTFRAPRSGPGYTNEAVEATTLLAPCEDPAAVLAELAGWVEGQLDARQGRRDEFGKMERDIDEARDELRRYSEMLVEAKVRWERAEAFLKRHGVEVPEDEVIPF